jgi:hypothetical protein
MENSPFDLIVSYAYLHCKSRIFIKVKRAGPNGPAPEGEGLLSIRAWQF